MFISLPYLIICVMAYHLGSTIYGPQVSCESSAKLGVHTKSFQKVVTWNFLAMQILGPNPDLLNQKPSKWGTAIYV